MTGAASSRLTDFAARSGVGPVSVQGGDLADVGRRFVPRGGPHPAARPRKNHGNPPARHRARSSGHGGLDKPLKVQTMPDDR